MNLARTEMSPGTSLGCQNATPFNEQLQQWDLEPGSSRGEAGQPNLVEWAAPSRALNIGCFNINKTYGMKARLTATRGTNVTIQIYHSSALYPYRDE